MQQEWKKLVQEFDLWPLNEEVGEYTVPISHLPYQRADGKILTRQGQHRSTIEYKAIVNQGVNCIVQQGIRTADKQPKSLLIAIKRPKYTHTHLKLEAFVQKLAHDALERQGIAGAIAKPYDVFLFANEVRFTMEWIEGKSCYDFLSEEHENFQSVFLHVLLQISHIFYALSKSLAFDHRDMKLDNIWIRRPPSGVTYVIQIDGTKYTYACPFQIVLLDFGFACLGTASRKMLLNLGNVIPDIDTCPKEGRDLYHTVNRLLEQPEVAEKVSTPVRDTLLEWLKPVGPSQQSGSHVKTAPPDFSLPALNPRKVLLWCLSQIN